MMKMLYKCFKHWSFSQCANAMGKSHLEMAQEIFKRTTDKTKKLLDQSSNALAILSLVIS